MSGTFKGRLFTPVAGLPLDGLTVTIESVNPFGATAGYPYFKRDYKVDSAGYINGIAGVTLATDPDGPVEYRLIIPNVTPIEFDIDPAETVNLGEVVYGGTPVPDTTPFSIIGNLKEAVGDVAWAADGVITVRLVSPFAGTTLGLYLPESKDYKVTGGVVDVTDLLVPLKDQPVPHNYKAHYQVVVPDERRSTFDAYLNIDPLVSTEIDIADIIDGVYDTP